MLEGKKNNFHEFWTIIHNSTLRYDFHYNIILSFLWSDQVFQGTPVKSKQLSWKILKIKVRIFLEFEELLELFEIFWNFVNFSDFFGISGNFFQFYQKKRRYYFSIYKYIDILFSQLPKLFQIVPIKILGTLIAHELLSQFPTKKPVVGIIFISGDFQQFGFAKLIWVEIENLPAVQFTAWLAVLILTNFIHVETQVAW